MNREYIHKDTKTDKPLQQELQNYFQVINGTALYYENYVKQLEQELERYKNIVDELKKEKSKKYDYVREVRTFNNNISKKDLEKFPVLKQYQGKDISYIVYESIDIL